MLCMNISPGTYHVHHVTVTIQIFKKITIGYVYRTENTVFQLIRERNIEHPCLL